MGIYFYAGGPNRDGFEFAVDNPGYGEIHASAYAHAYDLDEDWRTELHGPAVGALLDRVTARALGTDTTAPDTQLPRFVTETRAREILPALQKAVALALGGTDRFERTWPDRNDGPPAPVCVRCGMGSDYSDAEGVTSPSCERYGHHPFGTPHRWDSAQELYRFDLERWERRKAREREQGLASAAGISPAAIDLAAERRRRQTP